MVRELSCSVSNGRSRLAIAASGSPRKRMALAIYNVKVTGDKSGLARVLNDIDAMLVERRARAGGDADGAARVGDVDGLAALVRGVDLDRRVDAARRGAADQEREPAAIEELDRAAGDQQRIEAIVGGSPDVGLGAIADGKHLAPLYGSAAQGRRLRHRQGGAAHRAGPRHPTGAGPRPRPAAWRE